MLSKCPLHKCAGAMRGSQGGFTTMNHAHHRARKENCPVFPAGVLSSRRSARSARSHPATFPMKRTFFSAALSILLAISPGATRAADSQPSKPNVIFILADDYGWRDLSCYGSTFYETPNLDRLAAQGMRFTQAYAACCVCSPTRASILTGKYPARLHITDWLPGRKDNPHQMLNHPVIVQNLPMEETTLAQGAQGGRLQDRTRGQMASRRPWLLSRKSRIRLQCRRQ
jgi:hypothetical protein